MRAVLAHSWWDYCETERARTGPSTQQALWRRELLLAFDEDMSGPPDTGRAWQEPAPLSLRFPISAGRGSPLKSPKEASAQNPFKYSMFVCIVTWCRAGRQRGHGRGCILTV